MLIPLAATYPQEVVVSYYEQHQSPLIIGIDSTGSTLNEQSISTLKNVKPYGVILMFKNITSYPQSKSLINSIHEYGKKLGIRIKVAVDEEGGVVSRFGALKEYPQYSGITDFKEKEQAAHTGFLKEVGVDINFAPVADIAYETDSMMKERAGGMSPPEVSDIISKIVRIQKGGGIESTLKHFPGHGRTSEDSHEKTPTIRISRKDWQKTDSKPFIAGIKEGAENIMTGHLIYPEISDQNVSISKVWLTDILRGELQFKGRILTDDLKMAGLITSTEIECEGTETTVETETQRSNDMNAVKIYKSLQAGATNPLIILSEAETTEVFNKWLHLEKECIKYLETPTQEDIMKG